MDMEIYVKVGVISLFLEKYSYLLKNCKKSLDKSDYFVYTGITENKMFFDFILKGFEEMGWQYENSKVKILVSGNCDSFFL